MIGFTKGIYTRRQIHHPLFIKKDSSAKTHRVKGTDGKSYFLKLSNLAQAYRIVGKT